MPSATEDAFLYGIERREVIRCESFALRDQGVDVDLVQPACINSPMDECQLAYCNIEETEFANQYI